MLQQGGLMDKIAHQISNDSALREFGRLEGAANNAGISQPALVGTEAAHERRPLSTSLTADFRHLAHRAQGAPEVPF